MIWYGKGDDVMEVRCDRRAKDTSLQEMLTVSEDVVAIVLTMSREDACLRADGINVLCCYVAVLHFDGKMEGQVTGKPHIYTRSVCPPFIDPLELYSS